MIAVAFRPASHRQVVFSPLRKSILSGCVMPLGPVEAIICVARA